MNPRTAAQRDVKADRDLLVARLELELLRNVPEWNDPIGHSWEQWKWENNERPSPGSTQ